MGSYADQVAVVTGGGRGIGAAIAHRLARLGMKIVICGRSRDPLETTATSIRQGGGQCLSRTCDVGDDNSVAAFAAEVLAKVGRVDVLVNNAGVGSFSTELHKLAPEEWDRVTRVNLRGPYLMVRAFAPRMIEQKGGHIINISSLAGKNALPKGAVYAATKWGLNGLTYSIAEELRTYGIRVSVICPGSVHTELSPHAGKDPQKMLQPEDIAHAVQTLVTQAPQSFISELLIRPTQKP